MSSDYQPTARLLSIQDAGWIEVGDARVFICDALGGLYALREQLIREVGSEFEAEIFYRAGFASMERLMQYCIAKGFLDSSEEGFERALGLLTTGGYGQFLIEESRSSDGWAVVAVRNSIEGWMLRQNGGRTGFVCDYARGLLRGVMHHLLAAGGQSAEAIECAEVSCLANGDQECRFVIGTQIDLTTHGYRVGDGGHVSVRETLLRLNRQLEEVLAAAQKDALTGLYNRSHFEGALRHRIEFANRRTDTLAIAMIDIDRFKAINDTRGHAVGDTALRQVARLLTSQARETDVVARYGGDEFTWLMPGTSVEAAVAVADRIRRLAHEEATEPSLTLSIGIAACPDDAKTLPGLIDVADTAMYRAKDEGGNRVKRYLRPNGVLRTGMPSAPIAVPPPVAEAVVPEPVIPEPLIPAEEASSETQESGTAGELAGTAGLMPLEFPNESAAESPARPPMPEPIRRRMPAPAVPRRPQIVPAKRRRPQRQNSA